MNEISGMDKPVFSMGENTGPKSKNVMGKDDFMKLLMTQIKYQDPMKPMDHQEFAAQLAQFGSLEQLTNIGAGIKGLKTGLGEGQKLQALTMIGKQVQVTGNEIELKEGQGVVIPPPGKSDMVPARVTVFDLKGAPVRQMELAGRKPGEEISWDGKDQDGNQLPPGKYTFRVHGVDQNGQPREIVAEHSGRVTGVEMEGEIPTLLVQTPAGQQRIELTKIKQVTIGTDAPASIPVAAPAVTTPPRIMPRLAENSEGSEREQPPVQLENAISGDTKPDLSALMGSFSR